MLVREYKEGDYLKLKPKEMHLREMGDDPVSALKTSIEVSAEVYCLVDADDCPHAIGGVRTNSPETLVWMVCSEKATEDKALFIRIGTTLNNQFYNKYGKNRCWLLADNVESIRWMQISGYEKVDELDNGELWVCYERS